MLKFIRSLIFASGIFYLIMTSSFLLFLIFILIGIGVGLLGLILVQQVLGTNRTKEILSEIKDELIHWLETLHFSFYNLFISFILIFGLLVYFEMNKEYGTPSLPELTCKGLLVEEGVTRLYICNDGKEYWNYPVKTIN